MSVEREMSLAEWCAKLPSQHVVNRELATLTKQLAALAEQNEKMREALQKLACLGNGEQYGNSIGNCIAQEAISLPDLTSPVLNRIRAEENEAIIAAANALENIASTSSSTRIRRVANDALTAIRARRK